jgi:protein-tyrosine phosphatase
LIGRVPDSRLDSTRLIEDLVADLSAGTNVSIHCRQGVGRAGLIAVSLLVAGGVGPSEAIERVSMARGVAVPETSGQCAWLCAFAAEWADRLPRAAR